MTNTDYASSIAVRNRLRATLTDEIAPNFARADLEGQRALLDALGVEAELPPELAVTRHWFAGIPSEWLTPRVESGRVILHLHGGGFSMGSCAGYRAFVGRIATACLARAVVPEYRLAPEHPFPAGLDDAVEVYATLLAHGIKPEQLIVMGDSAGGGLALSMLNEARRAKLAMPRALVLMSPWTDLTLSGESMHSRVAVDPWLRPELFDPICEHYLAGHDPADPRVSPLWSDLRGLPPTLVHVGDHEILLDDSRRLASRARAAGVELELEVGAELWHVWHMFAPALPDANAAIDRIAQWVDRQFCRSQIADAVVVQRSREVTRRQAFPAVTEKFSTST